MQETFLLEDIINLLIDLETLGNIHYKALAQMTDHQEAKALFENLAKEELRHKSFYETFKQQKVVFSQAATNDDYKEYMEVLLKNTMTFLMVHRTFEHFDTGFEIAVTLEKETLHFLNEMREVLGNAYQEDIKQLIDEERRHLKILLQYK